MEVSSSAAKANSRGIPAAPFIDNIEGFLNDQSPDELLRKMQENYSKYKLMEASLSKNKNSLKSKIPDIKNNIEIVKLLMEKKSNDQKVETQFELADGFYGNATVTPSTVCLWLGANVMVEYSFEEASELLTNNLQNAETNLKNLSEDLDFLKNQITTMEVNIARIYNYDVKLRRKKREQQGAQQQPQPVA